MIQECADALNELILEWESILTEEYNPLHIALYVIRGSISRSSFREMLYKLDSLMEIIISVHFRGFSDSVLSYNEFNTGNMKILEILDEAEEMSKIGKIGSQNKVVLEANALSEFYYGRYIILRQIKQIKEMFEEYKNSSDHVKRCKQIIKCLDVIDDRELLKIPGVFEYRKKIYNSYLIETKTINLEIMKFVFNGEINHSFECIVILGALQELERFIAKNFSRFLYLTLEETIVKVSKKIDAQELLCERIARKIEQIIENYNVLIELTKTCFKIERSKEDFYGNVTEMLSWLIKDDNMINTIQDELSRFVRNYSVHLTIQGNFSVQNIIDTIDYSKIYPGGTVDIFNQQRSPVEFIKNSNTDDNIDTMNLLDDLFAKHCNLKSTENREYTVIFTPKKNMVAMLLEYIKTPKLRQFLRKQITTKNFRFMVNQAKKKIDRLLSMPLEINMRTHQLSFLRDIIEIIKQDNLESYIQPITAHLAEKTKEYFNQIFETLFTSKIVRMVCKKIEVFDPRRGLVTHFDPRFREALAHAGIFKNEILFAKRKYLVMAQCLNSLKELERNTVNREITALCIKWFDTVKKQILVEFFYYFAIYYQKGCYSRSFYIEKIIQIIYLVYNETKDSRLFENIYENLDYFCRSKISALRVYSKKDLLDFIKMLKIIDEIMSEVEIHDDLNSLYSFYDDILEFKATDKDRIAIQERIKEN